jgi:hypothetical protein
MKTHVAGPAGAIGTRELRDRCPTAPVDAHDAETSVAAIGQTVAGLVAQLTVWFCGCVNGPNAAILRAPGRCSTEAINVNPVVRGSVLILKLTVWPVLTLMSVANP